MVPDDEPTSGVSLEAEDVAADEAGVLAGVLAGVVCVGPVEVSTDEDVTLGAVLDLAAAVDEAEEEEEDVAGAVADDPPEVADPVAGVLEVAGVGVVHLGVGAGPGVFVFVAAELELLLALGLGLAVLLVPVLGLAVLLVLGLAVLLVLGLGLGVSLGLAVSLLSPPLDDTSGVLDTLVCTGVVALPAEPDVGGADDGLREGVQVELWLGAMPAMFADGITVPVDDVGPEPFVDPRPPVDEGAPVMAELSVDPMCPTSARAAGTEARTTPTVNTVRPVAKAGRSMVSRQSRFGARRLGAGCSGLGRRPRKPRMAGQTALTPWCWLAWAERERIFSRIRSRPSAPGST